MSTASPEKLQALQALLQQLSTSAPEEATVNVPVQIKSSAFNLDNLTRHLVLEGTAIQAKLDEILFRTAQGEVQLKVLQPKEQNFGQMLPARMTLQLRPGPNGLEAVLVVGNKPISQQQSVSDASITASSALNTRQTLTIEIPKVGQVFGVTVLPNSLLTHTPNQQSSGQGGSAQTASAPPAGNLGSNASPIKALSETGPLATMMQKLGLTPPGAENADDHTMQFLQSYSGQTALPRAVALAAASGPLSTTIKILQAFIPEQMQKQAAAQQGQLQNQGQQVQNQQKTADEQGVLATVRGSTPSGQQILAVEDGLIAVRSNKSWPIGTKLILAIGPGSGLIVEKEASSLQHSGWEGLKEALDALGVTHPEQMRELIRMRLPQASAPQQLGGAMLFFMNALKNGDMGAWLGGESFSQLDALGKIDLIRKMQEEWQGRNYIGQDQNGQQWQGVHVPYLDQDKLKQFSFYVHEDGKNKNRKEGDAAARRFLIDVSLSRLGPVQVDGLVHNKKMDVIVRTAAPMPVELKQELQGVFQLALEEVRYTGSLAFQNEKRSFVNIAEAKTNKVLKEI